jgi:8-oxo-dGTP pyrophosphatase MutT (NUDIX family)
VPPEEAVAGNRRGFVHLGDEQQFHGWRISVVDASFRDPHGDVFHRDIVRHPGAVAVVPVTDDDKAMLVRQYRGAVDRWLLEIPAGTRDVDGEAPEVTAGRELEEEVGVRAGSVEHLATIYNTPGFCDEETLVYLATALSPATPARHGPEEQHIEVVEVALHDVDAMVASRELTDAQTVIGLLLARARLARSRALSQG